MIKKIKRKDKEVSDFLKSVDYSSTPLLIDLLDRHCLFFDSEFKALMKCVSTMHDICKRIYKRFERRETIQISPSVARYVEFDEETRRYPHILYNFTARDARICIVHIKMRYHICCLNFEPSYTSTSLSPCSHDSRLYGDWSELNDEVLNRFLDCVFEYCSKNLKVLF